MDSQFKNLRDKLNAYNDNVNEYVLAYSLGKLAFSLTKRGYVEFKKYRSYSVAIENSDLLYPSVHEWFLSTIKNNRIHNILVELPQAELSYGRYSLPTDAKSDSEALRFYSDDNRQHTVKLNGESIRIRREKEEGPAVIVNNQRKSIERFIFTAKSPAGMEEVVELLQELALQKSKKRRKRKTNILDGWGEWRTIKLPPRSVDSVILPSGQMEYIVNDLEQFLASEEEYVRRCIPWHRGYLFHGAPGTGKSSIARALADHFNLDLWYLSLADLEKDSNLSSVLGSIDHPSVLLLEDIDTLSAATTREGKERSVTMSGLLNALDGIITPHGLITIMTTNDIKSLDPAMLRAGRSDVSEHIGLADLAQLERLFIHFYGFAPKNINQWPHPIAPAEVIEYFKNNLDDGFAAEEKIIARKNET